MKKAVINKLSAVGYRFSFFIFIFRSFPASFNN